MSERKQRNELLAQHFRRHYPHLASAGWEDLQRIRMTRFSSESERWAAVLERSTGVVAAGEGRLLSFDTDLYGEPMGRIEFAALSDSEPLDTGRELVQRLVKGARSRSIRHLHYRVPVAARTLVLSAQCEGFIVVSGNIHFCRDLSTSIQDRREKDDGFVSIRSAQPDDRNRLRDLTAEAFCEGTRFHADPYLEQSRTDALHERWIDNCLDGEAADEVLVAAADASVAGYVTVQSREDFSGMGLDSVAEIGLFAVGRAWRGRGVGSRLLQEALGWAIRQGADAVLVDTELDNVAAQKVYAGSGFRVSYTTYSLSWSQRKL